MILLNPKQHDRPYPDARSTEVMRKTIEFFEAKGKDKLLADYYEPGLVRRLPRVREGRTASSRRCARRPARARADAPLGHLAHLRVRRDPRLLRPPVLVHLAGLGARARPDLDERATRRCDSAQRRRSRTAASSPSGSPRSTHGADIYSTDMVLTRDGDGWRANGASTTSATATRPRSSRRSAASPASRRVRLLRRRPARTRATT